MSDRKSPRSPRKQKRQPRKAQRYPDYQSSPTSGMIGGFTPDRDTRGKRSDGGYIDRVPPPRS